MYSIINRSIIHTVAIIISNSRCSKHLVASRRLQNRGMRHYVLSDDNNKTDDADQLHQLHNIEATSTLNKVEDRRKIINLANAIEEKIRKRESFCSFELFPTKNNLVYQSDTQQCSPIFYAITWHENNSTTLDERFPTLDSIKNFPQNTLLHLTAKGFKRIEIEKILDHALEIGITNIFALQGDRGSDNGDFTHAFDLVTFIREKYDTQFCICVAGYPEMHPKSPSKELDLFYLKKKVNAGADFIITQLFFESRLYIQFVEDCRKIGIRVPIIPGIFPFTNTKLLYRMIDVCHASIPVWIKERLQLLGDDDEAVRRFGIDLSVQIIKEIREKNDFYGYHLYTLNRAFSTAEIHKQLDTESNTCNISNKI